MSTTPACKAPAILADHRAARARRRVRAGGRVPSDFMPFDDGVDPENDHPVEGGGIPWAGVVAIGALALLCLVLMGRGLYSFLN